MKVLHLINTLLVGGAELHLLTLCRHLRELGIESKVAYLRGRATGCEPLEARFAQEGFSTIYLESESSYDLSAVWKIVKIIQEEKPEIIHSHLPRADFIMMLVRFFGNRTPWVCSVHDIHSNSWSAKWAMPLARKAWLRADRVIAISYAVKQWLTCSLHIPATKISVVHYGIDVGDARGVRKDIREEWGLLNQKIIGSLGRIEQRKGHDVLIKAMPDILRHIPDARLLIAGHDITGYSSELRTLINRLDLDENVELVGFQEDVASFLQALDIFAFGSRSEGFGQVVIEAMAAGKPVVCSKVPPLTEIVIDGETGYLVEVNDSRGFSTAIVGLLSDMCKAQELGQNSRRRVIEHFSPTRMARETKEIYTQISRIK